MQRLRHARLITRWVLAGFAWVVAASLLSPLLRGGGELQILCSAMGVVMVDDGSSGAQPGGSTGSAVKATGLDCPLCLHFSAPPPQVAAPAAPVPFGAAALPPAGHAPHALRAAAPPLPARGPPASS